MVVFMINNFKYLDVKPISAEFICFLERYYPDAYEEAVRHRYENIPGECWSEYWKHVYGDD